MIPELSKREYFAIEMFKQFVAYPPAYKSDAKVSLADVAVANADALIAALGRPADTAAKGEPCWKGIQRSVLERRFHEKWRWLDHPIGMPTMDAYSDDVDAFRMWKEALDATGGPIAPGTHQDPP